MDKTYEKYWNIIIWVIHGEATPEQEEMIRLWREADPEHERFFRETERLEQTLCRRQAEPSFDAAKGWTALMSRMPRKRELPRSVRYALSIAAVLVLLIGFFNLFTPERPENTIRPGSTKAILVLDDGAKLTIGNDPMHIKRTNAEIRNDSATGLSFHIPEGKKEEVVTYSRLIIPQGGEYKLTLPDGTQVWLNSESELRFPSRFSPDKRVVEFSGEAYFEVSHDPHRPFYVKTSGMEVKVYGTEFNLNAYPDQPSVATTLVKGHVAVIPAGENQEIDVLPSQQLTFSKTDGTIEIKEVDVQLYTSWRIGVYTFENASLQEIFSNIRRWYIFEVDYQEEELRDFRFTCDFQKDRPIIYGLDLIRKTCEVNFKIQGNHILVTR